jgi:glycosyltransferase involved in cell wall biosynthesis
MEQHGKIRILRFYKMKSEAFQISTIIPYWNGKDFIHEALESIAREELVPDEILIVNDGSTCKKSLDLLKHLPDLFALNIRIINQTNTGQGGARNNGAKQASSEYITFLDQDDMSMPSKNRLLLKALRDGIKSDVNCAYATGDAVHVNEAGYTVRNNILKSNRHKHNKTDILHYIEADVFQLPGATLFRKDIFLSIGGFDGKMTGYEDDDLFTRIYRAGYSSKIIERELIKWRINKQSTSYSPKMQKSRLYYAIKLLENYPNDQFQKRFYTSYIKRRFQRQFINDITRLSYQFLARPSSKSLDAVIFSVGILVEFTDKISEIKMLEKASRKNRFIDDSHGKSWKQLPIFTAMAIGCFFSKPREFLTFNKSLLRLAKPQRLKSLKSFPIKDSSRQ